READNRSAECFKRRIPCKTPRSGRSPEHDARSQFKNLVWRLSPACRGLSSRNDTARRAASRIPGAECGGPVGDAELGHDYPSVIQAGCADFRSLVGISAPTCEQISSTSSEYSGELRSVGRGDSCRVEGREEQTASRHQRCCGHLRKTFCEN